MKALSIQQPWAWLIVHGHKGVENREWPTKVRGRFAIHAGQTLDRPGFEWVRQRFPNIAMPLLEQMPRGGIVGYAYLGGCIRAPEIRDPAAVYDPWFIGPWGFTLHQAEPCDLIPCPGRLGFFEVAV